MRQENETQTDFFNSFRIQFNIGQIKKTVFGKLIGEKIYGQRKTRSIQRRRDCDFDYDYGFGTENSARRGFRRAAIILAFINHWISNALYVLIALIWLIPDRRIESQINRSNPDL